MASFQYNVAHNVPRLDKLMVIVYGLNIVQIKHLNTGHRIPGVAYVQNMEYNEEEKQGKYYNAENTMQKIQCLDLIIKYKHRKK
jgi:hypothetical protein